MKPFRKKLFRASLLFNELLDINIYGVLI